MVVTLTTMSKNFYGTIVAKLPFELFSVMNKLSHRGIESEDYTDCSAIFLYVLSGIVFRTNIQKLSGFEVPQFISPSIKTLN